MLGNLLTIWTIRLALAAYALWLGMLLVPNGKWPSGSRIAASRWLYTLACGLFLAHVACAFEFYHHWGHQSALEDTARQTAEMLGFAFGEGIYFSYLFMLVWVADAAWLWLWPQHRPAWLIATVQLYLAFIALNGAVVFETGVTRWVGIPVAALLAGIAAWRLRTPHSAFRIPHSS
jgi:hypothetical protein